MTGEIWAVVVAAGRGGRVGASVNKVYLPLCGRAVLGWTLQSLQDAGILSGIVIVHAEGELDSAKDSAAALSLPVCYAIGGASRAGSVKSGLQSLPKECGIVLVHDGARPFPGAELIRACAESARERGSGIAARPLTDTIKRAEDGVTTQTISREGLFAVQTPQAFKKDALIDAYESVSLDDVTDDAQVYERAGRQVFLTQSIERNDKITMPEDLVAMEAYLQSRMMMRVGTGYDVHRLAPGRTLILCGVTIPHDRGLDGHSDADVAVHALIDALLGACALGDIGMLFPDSDPRFKGADSIDLLKETLSHMIGAGFTPLQVDLTIIAQSPKLTPYKAQMRQILSDALNLPLDRVSVKATTTEKLGFTGRGEGIATSAVVTVGERIRQ